MTFNTDNNMGHFAVYGKICLRVLAAMVLVFTTPLLAAAQNFSTSATGQQIGPDKTCDTANEIDVPIIVSGLTSFDQLTFGIQATTTYRGDLRIQLTSAEGTTVELVSADGGEGNDNLNIEIKDSATEIYTGAHNDADGTTAPPYENLVSSNNTGGGLASFNGENPTGTWTVNICDNFNADQGAFGVATLYFSNNSDADLSLSVNADNLTPEISDTVTLTYNLTNSGPATATNVSVNAPLPAGLTFVSSSGSGSYNSISGLWTLPTSLTNGSTSTLTVVTTAGTTGSATVTAEVFASDQADSDSTPNNAIANEDDFGTAAVNIQPSSTPPALNCPAADQFELAFGAPGNTNGWTSSSLTRTFTAADPVNATNINIDFALTGDTSFLGQISGSNTPVSQNGYTGGVTPAEYSVGIAADFNTTAQFVTMEMDIGTPGVGIGAFQFTIFDVDLGGWVDRLQFRGSLSGTTVSPTITPSTQNYVSGNEVIGQGGNAAATSSAGNVTVTFNEPVDRVEWDYGNDTSAGPNPAFQIIAMHTVKMCGRRIADLSAVKTVEVYDPGALGLYMIPGNEVLYKITVTNSATATASADDVDISDTLPDNLKFVSASTTGFIGGAFGTPALPAANTDCGITPCIVRFFGGDIAINSTAEIAVRAIIK